MLGVSANNAAIALTNARLFERSRELTVAQERTRIARDPHDAVAQKLFSLRLIPRPRRRSSSVTRRRRSRSSPPQEACGRRPERAPLGRRRVAPPDLEEEGLASALRRQVEVLDRVHGASVRFEDRPGAGAARGPGGGDPARGAGGAAQRLPARTRQPGHAALPGGEAGAFIEGGPRRPRFRRPSKLRAGRSLGLASMRERAAAVGGRLRVECPWERGDRAPGGAGRWLSVSAC
ncbi:MAG: histidine kinase [Carbonactinosporaceae bacterium]